MKTQEKDKVVSKIRRGIILSAKCVKYAVFKRFEL